MYAAFNAVAMCTQAAIDSCGATAETNAALGVPDVEMVDAAPEITAEKQCGDVKLNEDFYEHLNSLEALEDGWDVTMADANEAPIVQESNCAMAQVIVLQTDLQDAMHVAKPVTNIDEVINLCNMVEPNSACTVPKLRLNFEKLDKKQMHVLGVLGEPQAIKEFLESCAVPAQAIASLTTSIGLYALHHQQRLLLILWPGQRGWDQALRRPFISFVQFLLQLAPDICWLVGQKDLDAVLARGQTVQTTGTSRSCA